MKPTTRLIVLAIGSALTAAVGAQQKPGSTVRCWTERGQTVCGDAIPSSAAGAAQREINSSGVTVSNYPRALNPSEQAAKAAADKAAADKAAAEADEQRKRLALAVSYPTEEELQRVYKSRAEAADAAVTTARSSLANQRLQLSRSLLRAGDSELAGKPVAKPVLEAIAREYAQVQAAKRGVDMQIAARAAVDAEVATALAQWRKAKGVAAPAAATPAPTAPASATPAPAPAR